MRLRNWNENRLKLLTRINWRASLVPAAAVIPAPIAYIKVVAVKKLVVGCWRFHQGVVEVSLFNYNFTLTTYTLCGISSGGWR